MQNLTNKKIFKFWLPLLATWLMMSIEGPYLAALIARMIEPKFNLAAYGVAYSFGLIAEAPIIMIMSAATALVKDRDSFIKLKNFTYAANVIITLILAFCLIPPVFNFISMTVIGLPKNIADLTFNAMFFLLPWPAAIGYRRLYHGILIKNGLTRRVAYGTVIRLASMSLTALLMYLYLDVPGVIVGACGLSAGVIFEAIATKLMCLGIVKKYLADEFEEVEKLNYRGIFRFYYPLAMTSILSLGVHPMVTFFMGQSRFPIESLAVLPVVNSLIFIFRAVGLSYQEVIIALMDDKNKNYKLLKNFAVYMSVGVMVILGLITFSPLSTFWFRDISGLSLELTQFAITPSQILFILPVLTILISFQRAMLVNSRKTKPITMASILEVCGILLTLFILTNVFDFVGAVAAAAAYVAGRILSNTYLMKPFINAIGKEK
ncbi:MAG: hypothetical protein JEY94_06295 [Melioribacteraceae bacterium]|nr:hypothetical protein [Melioribacteraceae bacterium]